MLVSGSLILLVCLALLPSAAQALTFFVGTTGIEQESETLSVPKKSTLTDDELGSVYNFCRLLPFIGHKMKVTPESKEICDRLIDLLRPVFEGRAQADSAPRSAPRASDPQGAN